MEGGGPRSRTARCSVANATSENQAIDEKTGRARPGAPVHSRVEIPRDNQTGNKLTLMGSLPLLDE